MRMGCLFARRGASLDHCQGWDGRFPGALVRSGAVLYSERTRGPANCRETVMYTECAMSIDKSLRRKNQLARSRNVLTRAERIKVLQNDERWPEGRSPYGLPKVRVFKVV